LKKSQSRRHNRYNRPYLPGAVPPPGGSCKNVLVSIASYSLHCFSGLDRTSARGFFPFFPGDRRPTGARGFFPFFPARGGRRAPSTCPGPGLRLQFLETRPTGFAVADEHSSRFRVALSAEPRGIAEGEGEAHSMTPTAPAPLHRIPGPSPTDRGHPHPTAPGPRHAHPLREPRHLPGRPHPARPGQHPEQTGEIPTRRVLLRAEPTSRSMLGHSRSSRSSRAGRRVRGRPPHSGARAVRCGRAA
jgi:hypothetical protein